MFENIMNLDELRKAYRAQAMKAHPDHGGSTEEMQRINAAFEKRFEELKAEQNARADADPTGKTRRVNETPEQFRAVLEKLLHIPDIIIELCGSWVWVSGNTRPHKDELKAAGCFWANQKKMWYIMPNLRKTARRRWAVQSGIGGLPRTRSAAAAQSL